ncbi:MAG: CIA30 family protein [Actinobacteria bacterium]|nr:CIA30 family protein [Actinomycetota bacterium]
MSKRLKLMTSLLGISFVVACGSSSDEATSSLAPPSVQSSAPTTAVTTSTTMASTTTTPIQQAQSMVLSDFADQSDVSDWFNQNDTVMGGVSDSATTWVDGHLVFSGNLSLDNNGGFTSTFGPINDQLPTLMLGAEAIVVTARGDGKTYLMQIRNYDNTRYIQRFTTVADVEQDYVLPLADFESVDWRLSVIPNAAPIDTTTIAQLGFYLLDKQVGPFELAISMIRTNVD